MVIQGIFLVPYPRNPHFVGRKSHLDELVDGLENIGGISYRRRAIFGLGGVGKTQIVMEYAFGLRQRAPKTSVFWVHGSTSARFEQSYVEIAKQANIKGIDDPNKDPKILVKEWLCRKDSGTWLMIVDNADNCEIFFPRVRGAWRGLAEYLPKTANGSIIFTTRDKTAGLKLTACGPKGCIEVKKMEEMDCMSLLRTRMDPEQPFCETEANELLKLLDYLPLAVVQATAFMAENQIGLKDYLYLYQESPDTCIELLSHDFEVCDREGLEIPNAVTHTWMISFKEIQKRDTKAVELLSFLSCLDRQGICAELLPQMKRLDLVKARGVLLAFSLITFDQATETISMHRLVHIATRGWLQQEQKLSHWIKVALDRLAEHFPPTGEWFTNLTLYASTYLPH
ncbi:P-loop containing nucleoside triphosphate hydrolase protein, partial [Geopyxis carbonaria]